MELFTVQQIIGCDDETILAAGTVDYIGFSYYMTNAVRCACSFKTTSVLLAVSTSSFCPLSNSM